MNNFQLTALKEKTVNISRKDNREKTFSVGDISKQLNSKLKETVFKNRCFLEWCRAYKRSLSGSGNLQWTRKKFKGNICERLDFLSDCLWMRKVLRAVLIFPFYIVIK